MALCGPPCALLCELCVNSSFFAPTQNTPPSPPCQPLHPPRGIHCRRVPNSLQHPAIAPPVPVRIAFRQVESHPARHLRHTARCPFPEHPTSHNPPHPPPPPFSHSPHP